MLTAQLCLWVILELSPQLSLWVILELTTQLSLWVILVLSAQLGLSVILELSPQLNLRLFSQTQFLGLYHIQASTQCWFDYGFSGPAYGFWAVFLEETEGTKLHWNKTEITF